MLPLLAVLYVVLCKQSIVPENERTLYFTCIYYNITMLAFTSGYHKYFAHNSFKVKAELLKYYFCIFGSSCGLGSVRWWAGLHRAHHHFTDDTERDPYLIKRGFCLVITLGYLRSLSYKVLFGFLGTRIPSMQKIRKCKTK